jgi:hypothetical protein
MPNTMIRFEECPGDGLVKRLSVTWLSLMMDREVVLFNNGMKY